VGWLPRQTAAEAPQAEAGPEAWFSAKTVPDTADSADVDAADPLEQYLVGLNTFMDAYGYEPDEHKLAEHLFANHGVTGRSGDRPVSVETLRRHWPELQQRYAERYA
jgi:hypothetical protein